jgi:hypothetical protein
VLLVGAGALGGGETVVLGASAAGAGALVGAVSAGAVVVLVGVVAVISSAIAAAGARLRANIPNKSMVSRLRVLEFIVFSVAEQVVEQRSVDAGAFFCRCVVRRAGARSPDWL